MLLEIRSTCVSIRFVELIDGWVCGVLRDIERPNSRSDSWLNALEGFLLHYSGSSPNIDVDTLLEFVNLRSGEPTSAITFLEKYGLFDRKDHGSKGRSLPDSVRLKLKSLADDRLVPFATSLADFCETRAELVQLMILAGAVQHRDAVRISRTMSQLNLPKALQWAHDDFNDSGSFAAGRSVLGHYLTSGLKGIRLGLANPDPSVSLLPFASAADLRSGLYLALISSLEHSWEECANPGCPKLFEVTRSWRKFCSQRCQSLLKTKRWQAGNPRNPKQGSGS